MSGGRKKPCSGIKETGQKKGGKPTERRLGRGFLLPGGCTRGREKAHPPIKRSRGIQDRGKQAETATGGSSPVLGHTKAKPEGTLSFGDGRDRQQKNAQRAETFVKARAILKNKEKKREPERGYREDPVGDRLLGEETTGRPVSEWNSGRPGTRGGDRKRGSQKRTRKGRKDAPQEKNREKTQKTSHRKRARVKNERKRGGSKIDGEGNGRNSQQGRGQTCLVNSREANTPQLKQGVRAKGPRRLKQQRGNTPQGGGVEHFSIRLQNSGDAIEKVGGKGLVREDIEHFGPVLEERYA